MGYGGLEHVSWPQYSAALRDLQVSGDDDVLEDLGYVRSSDTLARHVQCAAEVARVLGIDMRSDAEKARGDAHAYYADQFHLTGPVDISDEQRELNEAGALLARMMLEGRRDTPS